MSQPSRLPHHQTQSQPSYPTFKATPSPLNTPFLFQTPANLNTFNDGDRATGSNFSFDPSAFNPVTAFGVTPQQPIQEVDMDHELDHPIPSDPQQNDSETADDTPTDRPTGVVSKLAKAASSWYGIAPKEDHQQPQEDELEVAPRKVASGAVRREQKKRAAQDSSLGRKSSTRRSGLRERRRRYDDEDDEATGSGTSSGADTVSSPNVSSPSLALPLRSWAEW